MKSFVCRNLMCTSAEYTDSLRFSRPQKPDGWDDAVFTADKFGPDCPRDQDLVGQDEDCLYLNVYRPKTDEILPVMVWIHSDMVSGSGGAGYDGKRIVAIGNVVLVTFNYRIGALGFFSTGDDEASGNFGLLDQNMVLEWIHENIEYFGGDATQITLFGDDDSSAMIGYQSVNVLNDGSLFNRIIHQSGVGQMKTFLPLGDKVPAANLAEDLECSSESSSDMVTCLRGKPLMEFMTKAQDYPATVVVDGYFLTDQPLLLFRREVYSPQKYDYLISFTSGEGSANYLNIMDNVEDKATFNEYIEDQILLTGEFFNPQRVMAVVKYEYADVNNLPGSLDVRLRSSALDMHGDKDVIAPSFLLANMTVTAQSTLLRPRNRTFLCHVVSGVDEVYPSWVGAPRGTIEKLVWANFNSTEYSEESLLADRIVEYWTSFAWNGKPRSSVEGDVWANYDILDGDYVELNAVTESAIKKKYFRSKYTSLWNILIPRIDDRFSCDDLQEPDTPVVVTDNGIMIHGYADRTDDSRSYDVFRGLPYAEPPIGNFRFRETPSVKEISSPNSTVYANIRKPRCLQTANGASGGFAGEDCLYLDIWRPSGIQQDFKPVMFWICHGGYNVLGPHSQLEDDYSCDVDGRIMALDGDFVFVRVQYRIGVFGFLSSGDDVLPGNAGLSDLKNALKWVYENIEYFGGSKDKVTLAGDGFGGVLAMLLAGMSSEITGGTIQSVISQSASLTATWAYTTDPKSDLSDLAVRAGCQNALTQAVVSCLRDIDPLVLVTAAGNVPSHFPFGIYAEIGEAAITMDSFLDMKVSGHTIKDVRKTVATMPTLLGLNSGAGYRFTLDAYPEIQLIYGRRPIQPSFIEKIVENDIFLENLGVARSDEDNKYLTDFYIPWGVTDSRNEIRRSAVDYHTDAGFLVPVYDEIQSRLHITDAEPTFFYVYGQRTDITRAKIWQTAGADLGEEIPVIFSEDIDALKVPLGKAMRYYWANFVNTGSPNIPSTPQSNRWSRYDVNDRKTMIFEENTGRIVEGFRDQSFKTWQMMIYSPSITNEITSTTSLRETTTNCPVCPTTQSIVCTTQKAPDCTAAPILGSGLGMELSPSEADAAIEALFGIALSLAIIQVGMIIFLLYKRSKRSKLQTDALQFSNKIPEKPVENGSSKEFSAL